MNRLKEIEERLKAIESELDDADEARTAELEKEVGELIAERDKIKADIQRRNDIRSKIASGTAGVVVKSGKNSEGDEAETRAKKFAESGRMTVENTEVRAALVSGGTLATPTGVSGINDLAGAHSSILDMVKIVNCEGMGSNKVAYIAAESAAAAEQTEGSAATAKEATFGYVTITPTNVAVYAQISEQAKKQTPLQYEAKVKEQAFLALRKKAVSIVIAAMKASTLNTNVAATLSSGSGVINDKTLRNIVLNYGGDEAVLGNAVLFLNKTDLLAFGDVRGTNEKKAVYEIIPDGANPSTGIIKDGGLSVKYCLCDDVTACSGTEQSSSAAIVTMLYGNPQCFELDLFSPYQIKVSEDFAFTSLMDTIRGDVELGGDVVVQNGFVAYTIAKGS